MQQQSQSLIKGYQSPSVTETKLFSYCTTKSHFMYFHVSINVGLYTVSLRHCSPWLPSFTLLFFCQLNQASQCFHGVLMSTCSDGKEDSSKQQPLSASEEQHYAQFTKNKPKLTMHWTKTTPNRIEIKINSKQTDTFWPFSSCRPLFWPFGLTVRLASSSSQTKNQTQLARASAKHAKKHACKVTESTRT